MAFDDRVITNYIYLYHTDEYVLLPVYPDQVMDSMKASFSSTNALSRTAPVFSYNNSGPRSIQINLALHREMFDDENADFSNLKVEVGEDYVDTIIKRVQSIALPSYKASSKSVVPPMIAVRLGDDIFIKGVVDSQISVTYKKPILYNGKYAFVDISFSVLEVDPYDAETVSQNGSFRGLTRTFKQGIYKEED